MLSYLARTIPAYVRAVRSRDASLVSRRSMRVRPTQIDVNLHMNQAVYAQVLEAGRLDLVVRSGALEAWRREKVNVVVAYQNITYRRELRMGARYTLDTRAVGVDGRLLLLEGYFVVGDRVHAVGKVGLLSVGPSGVMAADTVAEMAAPFLVEPLVVEDWRVVRDPRG